MCLAAVACGSDGLIIEVHPDPKNAVSDGAQSLTPHAFADTMATYAGAIDTALSDPDPWHAFCDYIERVCAMQAGDRGFADVLTLTFPTAKGFEADRDRAYHGFVELIRRAKATGRLRKDFVPQDMILLLMANAGVVNATGTAAPDAWRRLVAYLLQSFAATSAAPLPAPPAPRSIYRALLRLQPKGTSKNGHNSPSR